MNDLIKTAEVSSELAGFEDRSLLLADDDRPFLTRLTRAMESRGFQVTAVDSVAEGLATIRRTAPAFDLPSVWVGKAHIKTADLKGKVTLLNFFASWCVPCQAEHPLLTELAKTGGFKLVGISYEDKIKYYTILYITVLQH